MRIRTLFLLAVGLVALGPAAAQTVYGPGGLFIHPSAFVAAPHTYGVNVSFFREHEWDDEIWSWLAVSLTYQATDRLQFGASYVPRWTSDEQQNGFGGFAKYQVRPDSPRVPAIAVTGSYLGGGFNWSSVSVVGSHAFTANGRTVFVGHAGVQWVHHTLPATSGADRVWGSYSVYGAAEVPIGRSFSLVGEIGSPLRQDPRPSSAIGIMWAGPRGMRLGIAAVNLGVSRDQEFFIGAGYGFGGLK